MPTETSSRPRGRPHKAVPPPAHRKVAHRTVVPTRKAAPSQPRKKHPTPFGVLIRQLRQRRELSQAALARACRISAGYVGLIEVGDRGEQPSLDIVKRFIQALDCDVDEAVALMRASGHLTEHGTLVPADRQTFASFVATDSLLTRDQKDLLTRLYESWVHVA